MSRTCFRVNPHLGVPDIVPSLTYFDLAQFNQKVEQYQLTGTGNRSLFFCTLEQPLPTPAKKKRSLTPKSQVKMKTSFPRIPILAIFNHEKLL